MPESPTTRSNADGFKGQYPRDENEFWAQVYRDAGAEPPWMLEYENGRVVGRARAARDVAPHHEA